jgi:hypothetical protein
VNAAAQPPRRAALQRPSVPDHPFAVPVPVDAPGPAALKDASPQKDQSSPDQAQSPTGPAAPATSNPQQNPGHRSRRSLAGQVTTITFGSKEEYDRVKLAFEARGLREGFRSLNDFMVDAVFAVVESLEAKYNNGRPFTEEDLPVRRRR